VTVKVVDCPTVAPVGVAVKLTRVSVGGGGGAPEHGAERLTWRTVSEVSVQTPRGVVVPPMVTFTLYDPGNRLRLATPPKNAVGSPLTVRVPFADASVKLRPATRV
jgi:hypothetical protein